MNQNAVKWIIAAIAVLGLAAGCVMFGVNLLPPRIVAEERGTVAPWLLTWAMIWMTALIAVAIAAFLVATAVGKVSQSQ